MFNKILAILVILNFTGISYCQVYSDNDTIAQSLSQQVAPIVDSENIKIGGGRFKALVKLDTIGYISDSTAVQGVKNDWIRKIEVYKSFSTTMIGNYTIQYNIIIEPKKRFYNCLIQYLIKSQRYLTVGFN